MNSSMKLNIAAQKNIQNAARGLESVKCLEQNNSFSHMREKYGRDCLIIASARSAV